MKITFFKFNSLEKYFSFSIAFLEPSIPITFLAFPKTARRMDLVPLPHPASTIILFFKSKSFVNSKPFFSRGGCALTFKSFLMSLRRSSLSLLP